MIRPPRIAGDEKSKSRGSASVHKLRAAEKLILGFLAYAVAACAFFPLTARERSTLIALNALSGSVILLLSRFEVEEQSRLLSSLRDALPCVLILVAYRESGLFVLPDPTHRLDHLFVRWDRALLANRWVEQVLSVCSPWLQYDLELAYLFCYPLVPVGLGSIYGAHRMGRLGRSETKRAVSHFWTAVLLALFFCYIIFPLFPLTPPRTFFHDLPGPSVRPLLRKVNFWILRQYGVQACIFPSGHVAATTATGLSVWAYLPRAGVLFLIAAVSVAVATVYGRYHYAADAVAGAVVGLVAYLVSRRIHRSG